MGKVESKLVKALYSHSSILLLHHTLAHTSLLKQQRRNPLSFWPPQHPSFGGFPPTTSNLPSPFCITLPPVKACEDCLKHPSQNQAQDRLQC